MLKYNEFLKINENSNSSEGTARQLFTALLNMFKNNLSNFVLVDNELSDTIDDNPTFERYVERKKIEGMDVFTFHLDDRSSGEHGSQIRNFNIYGNSSFEINGNILVVKDAIEYSNNGLEAHTITYDLSNKRVTNVVTSK